MTSTPMVLQALTASLLLAACHPKARPPELFAAQCVGQSKGWTLDELAEIAFDVGIDADARRGATVRISQEECKIYVFVNLPSLEPGSHYIAVVSAIDGKVLEIIGGQ
jgi:hypothetical protein